LTEHGSFVEAGSRVVRALVAVPRWIMALVRPDRSRRRRSGVVWTVTDLLLALVADTMLPEAFQIEGVSTGWLVAIGFAISIILSAG